MNKLSKSEKYAQCTAAAIVPSGLEATAFIYDKAVDSEGGAKLIYARQDYPGSLVAEEVIADYENAEASMAFSSGMAATTSVFLALQPGSSVIVSKQVYWPLQVWLNDFAKNFGIDVRWVSGSDVNDYLSAVNENTEMIWVEMLTNPDLSLLDVRGLSKRLPADIKLVVNATCLSPVLARPLDLQADLVVHSVSKIIGGHNDLLGGVVSTAEEDEFWERLCRIRWLHGNGMSARDASVLYRSLMTLKQRAMVSSSNALAIAMQLQNHELVESVVYPGLPNHPDHLVTERNLLGNGYGPLIGLSMRLDSERCKELCANMRIWKNATTFGGYCSCLEHRATAEYAMSQSPVNYLRLSAGLESIDVLIDDLLCSFERYQYDCAV